MDSATYQVPHSCEFCRRLTIELREPGDELGDAQAALLRKLIPSTRDFELFPERMREEGRVLLDITEDQLNSGADHGCFLYKELQYGYKECLREYGYQERSQPIDLHALSIRNYKQYQAIGLPEIKNEPFTQERTSVTAKVRLLAIYAVVESGRLRFRSVCEPNIGNKTQSQHCPRTNLGDGHLASFGVATDYNNPAVKFFSLRPINVDPGSERSLRRVKMWLEECYRDHESCPKPGSKFMPTRLLEITVAGGGKSVRVVETTSREEQPYAILSYCWGGDQKVKTTRHNLEQMKSGIDLDSLPATLRDAIQVTMGLDMRFLWVDALCIIQDDEHDKALEIAAMPNIYSSAAVAIAASRAASVEDGFLAKRPRFGEIYPRTFIDMRFRLGDGKVESLPLMNPYPSTPIEPLETRGWAFQERILSPRMLDYGTLTTEWICKSARYLRERLDGWHRIDQAKYPSMEAELPLSGAISTSHRVKTRVDSSNIRSQWHRLLKLYSSRNLTFQTDRLLAMSGIAERYAILLGDEYLAGIWRSSLARDILWQVDRPLPRSYEYSAPSWSWAAISGKVTVRLEGTVDANFQVIGCNVTHAFAEAQFGSVRSGRLQLRGLVRREGISFPSDGSGGLDKYVMEDMSGDEHTIFIYANIDHNEGKGPVTNSDRVKENHEAASTEALVLLLVNIHPCQMGLLLRECGNGEYVRLGVFEISSPPRYGDWSDEPYSEEQFAGRSWAFPDNKVEDLVVV